MVWARSYIWLALLFIFSVVHLQAQDSNVSLLDRKVELQFYENSILGHVDKLLIQENIIIAFNSSRVDLTEVVTLPRGAIKVREIVGSLFHDQNIKLTVSKNKIIVGFLDEKPSERITIKGYIRDSNSGEVLVGASIYEKNSNISTFSNEFGFYSLSIPSDSNALVVNYLGYKTGYLNNISNSSTNISLEYSNEIDQVIIEGSIDDNFLLGSGSEKIDLKQTEGFQSMSGDNDLIRAVRISPKVQSGNEGQVGLFVRGGSGDQNLILFDGIPLYEVSHTAGFASIFIEESIKDVDFISNGFPARYGGRLSSVMNVRLKDGNQSKMSGSANFSLPSMTAHLEGPLFTPKTTFNVSGRVSYVDKYLNQLIGDIVSFEDIDLDYYDFVGKITHRFSSTNKLSFSYYNGEDNLGLIRNNVIQDSIGDTFETNSNNGVSWGSTVWNLSFTNVATDQLQLSFNVGGIKYKNQSLAEFKLTSVVNNLSSDQELVVRTNSEIEDQMVGINLDYYLNDEHRLKFGGSWIHHNYDPSVIGSDTIINDIETVISSSENLIIADELSFYIEDTYTPNDNWQFYGGVHIGAFNIGSARYRNVQPRFSTVFTPDPKNRFTVSYSNMVQYVHLLVNQGIGIPSDFWVPSTETITPSSARQFSFGYSRKMGHSMELSISGYTKVMNNILEYSGPTDVFFGFINSDQLLNFQQDPNWQNSVISGRGDSRGLEFQVRKTKGKITGWFTYALSKADRQFIEYNDNELFPYKYDRRHDINTGINYKINERFSIAANFTLGTGNAFSLSLKEYKTPLGITLITGGERNNLRFPMYHHLDIQFNYKKPVAGGILNFNIGIYNAYNRKNAYYIYVYSSPINTEGPYLTYQTSLFPILPSMSLGYSF